MRHAKALLTVSWLFATTPGFAAEATDNFNRSNGGLGSNWTRNADDSGTLQIVGNRVQPAAETYGESLYTAATYGGAQFAEIQNVSGLSGGVINLVVRARQYASGTGTADSYRGQLLGLDGIWRILRVDNTVETPIASGSLTFADNDTFTFEANGSTLTLKRNGSTLGSVTDTAYTAGDVGIGTYNHVNLLVDNWRGGDYTGGDTQPPTAPSNLIATAASSSQINLTWTASTDNVAVTNYLIERCVASGCSSFGQVNTSQTVSYSDINLSASTSYSYRVRATDAAGLFSSYSNTASTSTQAVATQATDDFNRANGGLGGSWTTAAGNGGTLQILSNQVRSGTGTYGESIFSGMTFTAAQFSEVQHASGISGGIINLVVRASQYTSSGTMDGYRGQFNGLDNNWRILRVDNGVETQLALGSQTYASGDVLYFEANGSTLTIKRNGTTLSTFTDGTYASGDTGVGMYNHVSLLIDNWRGGQLGGSGDTQAPTQPANLAVVATSAGEIDLVWTPSTDNVAVTGYRVQRCQGAGCTPTSPEVATPALPYYNDTGRSAATSYTYRVQAFDAANNPSAWSANLTVVTPAASADCNF